MGVYLKRSLQFVGLLGVLVIAAPLALVQETHASHESGGWSQETTGALAAARNVRVKLDTAMRFTLDLFLPRRRAASWDLSKSALM
jgi:hypothetical protein